MDRFTLMDAFARVVETGSFVAAGEALKISRPMVSKQVQRLEDELGVRLLNRTTRRVSLTEAGRSFYTRCQEILPQVDEAIREASNLQVHPQGLLRLNAPHAFGKRHVAPAIAAYQKSYPDVTVDLILNDRVVNLVDEGYDLAVRIGVLADSSLIARKLAPCKIHLCAAPSYLTEKGYPASPNDLKHHNCLQYSYSSYGDEWNFTKDDKKYAVKVTGSLHANYGEALASAASEGLGFVLLPSFVLEPYLKTGELEIVLPEYKVEDLGIFAVFPQSRLLPPKVRTFIEFLHKRFGPEPYWDDLTR